MSGEDESVMVTFTVAVDGYISFSPWKATFSRGKEAEEISRKQWEQELEPMLREHKNLAQHVSTTLGSKKPFDADLANMVGGFSVDFWTYAILNASAWPSLAGVLKTYLTRRQGRKVIVYGTGNKKLLEVTGDQTVEEIEALLRARVVPKEVKKTQGDHSLTAFQNSFAEKLSRLAR